jgi:hypothetical protein
MQQATNWLWDVRSKPNINGYLVKFEFKVLARIWALDVEINMG